MSVTEITAVAQYVRGLISGNPNPLMLTILREWPEQCIQVTFAPSGSQPLTEIPGFMIISKRAYGSKTRSPERCDPKWKFSVGCDGYPIVLFCPEEIKN